MEKKKKIPNSASSAFCSMMMVVVVVVHHFWEGILIRLVSTREGRRRLLQEVGEGEKGVG